MRAITAAVALVGIVAWMGCRDTVDLGGRVRPVAVVTGAGAAPDGGCSQNSDCASGLCLGQVCCSLASCGTDPTCQGTSCDATGACVYPSGGCGTPVCAANQLTVSSCALGACVAGTPSACPGNLTCVDATSCRTSCSLTSECASGFYCSNGSCVAQLAAGTACMNNDVCSSGICGVTGSGRCCTATCSSVDPFGCGASDCDTSGACNYPSSTTPCGTSSCTGFQFTSRSCDGKGACAAPTTAACPDSLKCNPAGTSCLNSCFWKSDCVPENYCVQGNVCVPQVVVGACNTNDACTSGRCGLQGTGSCCRSACKGGTGTCGATGCDAATGACTYPAAGTACGTAGAGGACNGAGLCTGGATYYVDGTNGADTATCGPQTSPCLSMTQAMSLIVATGVSGSTLEVSNPSDPQYALEWHQANETWPIHLGMGVTAHAPSIYIDAPDGSDVFDVYAYNADDFGTVTIRNAWIGIMWGLIAVNDNVPNQTGLPLVLDGVAMKGASQDLSVGPGANVTLGPGGVAAADWGSTGIFCKGSAESPASVTDDSAGTNILWITMRSIDIDAEDYCTISLTQGPKLGDFCNSPGYSDTTGILAIGNASVTFGSNAGLSHIQCMLGNAIDMETSNESGSPTVRVISSLIQYSGCAGALVNAGTFKATASTFSHNHFGIQQGGGTVDVSGGGAGACTFECADSTQGGSCNGDGIPGIDVLNTTAGTTLTADNALVNSALDSRGPELWSCSDTTYSSCTCSGPNSCPKGAQALPEDADFVSLSTNNTPFSVKNAASNGSSCP
jgi:hypothetical protein